VLVTAALYLDARDLKSNVEVSQFNVLGENRCWSRDRCDNDGGPEQRTHERRIKVKERATAMSESSRLRTQHAFEFEERR
jgi:hypothetical protein